MKQEVRIPTLIGIVLAILGLIAGLWLIANPLRLFSGASEEARPLETRVTNVTDKGFVVTWTTRIAAAGYVRYSEDRGGAEWTVVSDERDLRKGSINNYFMHFVDIENLKPETDYKFTIGSGRISYFEQKVKTGPVIRGLPKADIIWGQVQTESGDPADGAIVYAAVPGSRPMATLVKASGSWVITLATLRSADGKSYVKYDVDHSVVSILVQAGPMGMADANVPIKLARPVNTLVVKKPVTPTPPPVATTSATLDVSNLDKGVFHGQAPVGAQIQVEINSETKVTDTTQANGQGQFTYPIPPNLAPGEHTITFTVIINGVAQKIVRSFRVEAAGPVEEVTEKVVESPTPSIASPPVVRAVNSNEKSTTSSNSNSSLILVIVLGILGVALCVAGVVWIQIQTTKQQASQ